MSTKLNFVDMSYLLKIAVLSPILSTKHLSTTALHVPQSCAQRTKRSSKVLSNFCFPLDLFIENHLPDWSAPGWPKRQAIQEALPLLVPVLHRQQHLGLLLQLLRGRRWRVSQTERTGECPRRLVVPNVCVCVCVCVCDMCSGGQFHKADSSLNTTCGKWSCDVRAWIQSLQNFHDKLINVTQMLSITAETQYKEIWYNKISDITSCFLRSQWNNFLNCFYWQLI